MERSGPLIYPKTEHCAFGAHTYIHTCIHDPLIYPKTEHCAFGATLSYKFVSKKMSGGRVQNLFFFLQKQFKKILGQHSV